MIIRIRFRTKKSTLARFVHPLSPIPRTAILAPGFKETGTVKVFPSGWNRQAARFGPASIAGPIDRLRQLAATPIPLERGLVAFTYEGQAGLTSEDRELFWDAFGVPVYEQLLGRDNRLLAVECDAHCGLHLVDGYQSDARIETEPCGCGNASARIARTPRVFELVELLA